MRVLLSIVLSTSLLASGAITTTTVAKGAAASEMGIFSAVIWQERAPGIVCAGKPR
jgi:hypothetical protein